MKRRIILTAAALLCLYLTAGCTATLPESTGGETAKSTGGELAENTGGVEPEPDPAIRAALDCLVYLGEHAPEDTDDAGRCTGAIFHYHQCLTEAERTALTALLRAEEWQALEEIPETDWFAAPVCAKSDRSARLLLRDDTALYVTGSHRCAWALPAGVTAAAEDFYAALEAQGPDRYFPLDVTAFTEVGYDLDGPGSFDVRFPLTGELQQRFTDAIHPETWQRYELFLNVGWTSSGLHAAAGDAVLTVYGMYDDGKVTAVLYTPDGLHLYTVPAEECAAIRQLYADIKALPVD